MKDTAQGCYSPPVKYVQLAIHGADVGPPLTATTVLSQDNSGFMDSLGVVDLHKYVATMYLSKQKLRLHLFT